MRKTLIGAAMTFSLSTAVTAECLCGDGANSFVYLTKDPAHYEWMEELPWRFLSIDCEGEDIIVYVELIGNGDEALNEGNLETQFSSIRLRDNWVNFQQFEKVVLDLSLCS